MFDTLESIGKAATAWRATRKNNGKRQRLPEELKRRAVGLLGKHKAREIALAVGISDAQVVERWRALPPDEEALSSVDAAPRSTPSFVEVVMPSAVAEPALPSRSSAPELQLELTAGEGRVLRLRGRLDAAMVRSLAEAMLHAAAVQP
jgi:transposase-like protein